MRAGALIITLRYSDIPLVSVEALEKITITRDGVVAEYVMPFIKRGAMEELTAQLSKMVQRDTLLDISKRSSSDMTMPGYSEDTQSS